MWAFIVVTFQSSHILVVFAVLIPMWLVLLLSVQLLLVLGKMQMFIVILFLVPVFPGVWLPLWLILVEALSLVNLAYLDCWFTFILWLSIYFCFVTLVCIEHNWREYFIHCGPLVWMLYLLTICLPKTFWQWYVEAFCINEFQFAGAMASL